MQMADWLSVLVAHLLRCPRTIETVIDRITMDDLQKVHGFTTGLLWTFSKEYFEKYQKPIPRTTLESDLVLYNTGTWLLEMSTDEVVDFIEWAYSIPPEDFNTEEAIGYTRRLLETTRVHHKVQEAALDGNMGVTALADIVNTGIEAASIGHVDVINPLENVQNMMGAFPPDPVGGAEVQYFNQLCQGGLRRGEVAVLLGPTGGFKTTMALDICCAMANTQEHSMYITYEQAFLDGDLPLRILARMAGVDKTRCEELVFDQLDQDEQKRIVEAQKRSHYLQFLDRSCGSDTVADIGSFVQAQERKGILPRVVVIDQLLQWLESWPEATPDTIRVVSRSVINTLKHQVASKYGVGVIVLHQLTAALSGGSSTRIPHHSESAECRSLCFWADFGIAMGNLNVDSNIFWTVTSKHRRGTETKVLIRPDGNRCHLKACDDFELSREGKFVPKGGAANMVTPTMSGPKRSGRTAVLGNKGDL